jgi:hypothetical protein
VLNAPVAVGGVGGSGTRVVAEVMRSLGIYMGAELNDASDNLWFTLLFRRPAWYVSRGSGLAAETAKAVSIFDKAMQGGGTFGAEDFRFVVAALEEVAGIHRSYVRPLQWAASLVGSATTAARRDGAWGWKEPNTHIYLEQLNAYYKGMKYVHVIRHGLDMAFSRNQFQLLTWGPVFGLPASGPKALLPKVALQYWIMANQRAISFGREVLGERFLLVRFEDLCASPEAELEKLVQFLGYEPEYERIKALSAAVREPESIMRYKQYSLDIFDEQQLAAVEALGFRI